MQDKAASCTPVEEICRNAHVDPFICDQPGLLENFVIDCKIWSAEQDDLQ
jgi:hypothetical protein